MKLEYAVVFLLLSSFTLGSCATSYNENLTFRRVCWGDGICKVEELKDGQVIATYGPNYGRPSACKNE